VATRTGWLWTSFFALLFSFSNADRVTAGDFPDLADLRSLTPSTLHVGSLDVGFDIPTDVACRDVTTNDFREVRSNERLVEVTIPVSLVLYHGEQAAIEEVVIEIDGRASDLRVVDYGPRTALTTTYAAPIERKRTEARDTNLNASLGGKLGPEMALTPGGGVAFSHAKTECETELLLPPRDATLVSGTVSDRRGVYFKLRASSQTTLEGEREFRVTFAAPRDWSGGMVDVRCVARGGHKWLFVEQQRVWSEVSRPVKLLLVSHTAAKPIIDEAVEDPRDKRGLAVVTSVGTERRSNTATGPAGVPLEAR
jgi:hypothetical protein